MPRDGNGQYTTPAGTHGTPQTTISSAAYNANVDDVAFDLNTPRPIVAGGTGASTAAAARTNLGTEAAQQNVTNFDTFAFQPGSWWCGGNTTGAPVPQSAGYYGEATLYGGGAGYMLVKAYENGTGIEHRRLQVNGAWGAWMTLDNPNNKVNRAGDTMTGQLNITQNTTSAWGEVIYAGATSHGLFIQGGSSGNQVAFQVNDYTGNTNFMVINGAGNGAWGTGQFDFNGSVHTNVNIVATSAAGAWPVSVHGAPVNGNSNGVIINAGSNNADYPLFITNQSGANLFNVRGDNITTIYGSANINNGLTVAAGGASFTGKTIVHGNNAGDWAAQVYAPGYGLYVSGGTSGSDFGLLINNAAQNSALFSVYGNGDILNAANHNVGLNILIGGQGYKPGGGSWADSSDIRIKNVIADYDSGLAEVCALEPVVYTYKGNDERDSPVGGARISPHQIAADSGQEFIGLIAQQCEGIMPELVSETAGYIDGKPVTDIRNIDATPLIYALVNAVKQLAARVEALEGVATPK